jgi:hypothetical protein
MICGFSEWRKADGVDTVRATLRRWGARSWGPADGVSFVFIFRLFLLLLVACYAFSSASRCLLC